MTSKFGEVLYIDTPYRPEPGSFGKYKALVGDRFSVQQWHFCREVWHSQLYNLNLFFFSHKFQKGYAVAEFMRNIEKKIDVWPRSEFGPTQRKTIMWVEPSRWWTKPTMRRSLFTILLRAGMNYVPEKDNFDEALFTHPYAKNTRYAVERFMRGHTRYTGKVRGWYSQFYYKKPSYDTVNLLLVRDV